jgi:hypothetical protein
VGAGLVKIVAIDGTLRTYGFLALQTACGARGGKCTLKALSCSCLSGLWPKIQATRSRVVFDFFEMNLYPAGAMMRLAGGSQKTKHDLTNSIANATISG